MSAPSTQARQSATAVHRLAEIGRQFCARRRRGFPAGANARGSRRSRTDGRAAARSSRRCRARRYGRACCEPFRARCFAPSAVTAPVRMSVMAVASRIARGMPVRGSNRLRIAEFRRQAVLVVVDIVADDLDAGRVERRDVAAQHVEMAVEGRVRLEMHARLDHRLAVALRDQAGFDRGRGFRRRSSPARRCRARSDSRCRWLPFPPKILRCAEGIYYGQAAGGATALHQRRTGGRAPGKLGLCLVLLSNNPGESMSLDQLKPGLRHRRPFLSTSV